jgi:hypothetical protein
MIEASYFGKPVIAHDQGVFQDVKKCVKIPWHVLPVKEVEIPLSDVPPFLQKVFHGTWWEVDEDAALRDDYGRTDFGQSALLARRLVENGVRFVTVNYAGWDHHNDIFKGLDAKLPEFAGKSPPVRSVLSGSAYGIRRCGQLGFTE